VSPEALLAGHSRQDLQSSGGRSKSCSDLLWLEHGVVLLFKWDNHRKTMGYLGKPLKMQVFFNGKFVYNHEW